MKIKIKIQLLPRLGILRVKECPQPSAYQLLHNCSALFKHVPAVFVSIDLATKLNHGNQLHWVGKTAAFEHNRPST